MLGVFPVVGTTTLLCTLAALGLRLNLVAIQTANYLVYPLQILFLLPLIRGGELLLGAEPLPMGAEQLAALVEVEGWRTIGRLWRSGLHAITAWSLIGPPLALALFALLRPVLRKALPRAPGRDGAGSPGGSGQEGASGRTGPRRRP